MVRVTYRYIRPLTVVYARCTGPYERSCREAWDIIDRWLETRQARRRVKQGYGLFRDNPATTAPELLRYDACVPLVPGLDADPATGIGRETLRGGAFAVHTYVGSYSGVGEAFSQLHRDVVPKRGLSVDYDRPFLAIYQNDPKITREVHRRTELCVPVIPICMPLSSNDDNEQESAVAAITTGRVAG